MIRTAANIFGQRVLLFAVSIAFAGCGGTQSQPGAPRGSADHKTSPASVRLERECDSATRAVGKFVTQSTTTSVQQVNGTLLVAQDVTFTITGDITGTALAKDTIVLNQATGTGSFFGIGTLGSGTKPATVLGRSGTIGFVFRGTFAGTPPHLQGQVVFLPETGTGQLAGLEASGTLDGIIDVGGTFSIQVCRDEEEGS